MKLMGAKVLCLLPSALFSLYAALIFAHDYYPGAETMMARHFQNPNNNYASKAKWNGGTVRQNAGALFYLCIKFVDSLT